MAKLCEICLEPFAATDLEDGLTIPAECCERTGLCSECRQHGKHDCTNVPVPKLPHKEQTVDSIQSTRVVAFEALRTEIRNRGGHLIADDRTNAFRTLTYAVGKSMVVFVIYGNGLPTSGTAQPVNAHPAFDGRDGWNTLIPLSNTNKIAEEHTALVTYLDSVKR